MFCSRLSCEVKCPPLFKQHHLSICPCGSQMILFTAFARTEDGRRSDDEGEPIPPPSLSSVGCIHRPILHLNARLGRRLEEALPLPSSDRYLIFRSQHSQKRKAVFFSEEEFRDTPRPDSPAHPTSIQAVPCTRAPLLFIIIRPCSHACHKPAATV